MAHYLKNAIMTYTWDGSEIELEFCHETDFGQRSTTVTLEKARAIELASMLDSFIHGRSTALKEEPKYYIHVVHEDLTVKNPSEQYVNYDKRMDAYSFDTTHQTRIYQTQFTQAEIDASPYLKKLEGFKVLVTE